MIKSIPVPIFIHYKIGNQKRFRRFKKMVEFTVNLSAKMTRLSKAYTFFMISLKSIGLAVQQLFKK